MTLSVNQQAQAILSEHARNLIFETSDRDTINILHKLNRAVIRYLEDLEKESLEKEVIGN